MGIPRKIRKFESDVYANGPQIHTDHVVDGYLYYRPTWLTLPPSIRGSYRMDIK